MKRPFFLSIVAVAVSFSSTSPKPVRADADADIAHEATKLNHRGVEQLQKKQYDQAIESFRAALKVQPEYAEALDSGRSSGAADC